LLDLLRKGENGKGDNQHGFTAIIEVMVRFKRKDSKGDN